MLETGRCGGRLIGASIVVLSWLLAREFCCIRESLFSTVRCGGSSLPLIAMRLASVDAKVVLLTDPGSPRFAASKRKYLIMTVQPFVVIHGVIFGR